MKNKDKLRKKNAGDFFGGAPLIGDAVMSVFD